eukprot:2452661-Pleurochrysis_carterae.AAC.6
MPKEFEKGLRGDECRRESLDRGRGRRRRGFLGAQRHARTGGARRRRQRVCYENCGGEEGPANRFLFGNCDGLTKHCRLLSPRKRPHPPLIEFSS